MTSLYKTIREALQEAAGNVPAESFFHYGDDVGLNIFTREGHFPVVHCYHLNDEPNFQTNTSRISVVLLFLAKDTADSTNLEQAALIEEMELLCNLFFLKLSENDLFDDVTVTRRPMRRTAEAVLTGMRCAFTLNPPLDLC